MSLEEFKAIDSSTIPVGNLIAMIARGQQIYLNHHLDALGINATQFHLLIEISNQCDINQENISKRCNINKGAVARSIKKLEDKGLVIREIDENNKRQNIISLTQKGKNALNHAISVMNEVEDYLFDDDVEKELLQNLLKDLAIKSISLNENGFDKK